jgi:nicotinate-nucleotide adenylyltransferase
MSGDKIGILGGTFNPIHLGHLIIAQDAMEEFGLDRVRFIPAAIPPHKTVAGNVSATHRLAMLRLGIRGNPQFEIDRTELDRGGTSYSVDTLAELRRREDDTRFFFIIGADSLRELHTWREVERLVDLCTFITVARPGFEAKPATDPHLSRAVAKRLRQHVLHGHACAISSRDIRARIARGASIRYLVPDAVGRYIHAHKLYHASRD